MKYYRVKVKLKTGFEYSYTCIGRMLEGMKKSSEGYWTESVVSEEINEEDFKKTREVAFETEKKVTKVKKVNPVVEPVEKNPKAKKSNTKFSSLENFFESEEVAPKNKKLKKRV